MPAARYPLLPNQIAALNYQARLMFDEELRKSDSRYASFGCVDDILAAELKKGMAGSLTDEEMHALVGERIERYRQIGNTSAKFGTKEWRELAMPLCFSEYEAMARAAERDEGDWTGVPVIPFLAAEPIREQELPPVKMRTLFDDYIASRKQIGKGREAGRRWTPAVESLIKFVGHDDARKVTKTNLRLWRDVLVGELDPKTVSDVYLASIRTILQWAVSNDILETNVAVEVRQEVPKKIRNREKGYTTPEATKILAAAAAYKPKNSTKTYNQENPQTTAAKRWTPFLCAFSGARVVEITQLRTQDFRTENGAYVMRIKPDAGTVKTGLYRDVPIHAQLLDMGFQDFVEGSRGPLFYSNSIDRDALRAARTVAASVGRWLHANNLSVPTVPPNHGWRHRFKTVGREVGIADRVLDALTGHSSTTVGDSYGDVTIATMVAAISKLPSYEIPGASKA
jgi:integrase